MYCECGAAGQRPWGADCEKWGVARTVVLMGPTSQGARADSVHTTYNTEQGCKEKRRLPFLSGITVPHRHCCPIVRMRRPRLQEASRFVLLTLAADQQVSVDPTDLCSHQYYGDVPVCIPWCVCTNVCGLMCMHKCMCTCMCRGCRVTLFAFSNGLLYLLTAPQLINLSMLVS